MGDAAAEGGGAAPVDGIPQVVERPGEPARQALWALVDEAKGGDPLRPVTVAVPSPYAGLALRRRLGRERGLLNVRFLPLGSVAELLGAPALAAEGRVPLSAPRRVEAVHAVLTASPGPFAVVADQRSTEEALGATFADLRRVPVEALEVVASRTGHAAVVVRLYRAFRERTASTYDEEDVAVAAAAAVEDGSATLDELGAVIAFLTRDLSAGEHRLLGALAAVGRATLVLDTSDGDHTAAVATRVVSVPDPEDEARAVVRRLLVRAAAGVPLHRMAVLYPVADPYARLVPQILEAADVPWNGPSPTRLADSVAGRVLAGLVDLVDEDFARDAVASWLVSGPIRDAEGQLVPSTRWDVVSRRAGVVAGAEQWRSRLHHYRSTLEQQLVAAAADDEASEGRSEWMRGEIHQVEQLEQFVSELFEEAGSPAASSWAQFGAWARDLLVRYLGDDRRRGDWTESEVDAARRVDGALAELMTLDDLGGAVDLARFRAAVDAALAAPAPNAGRFGTGVFVGPLRAAVGGDFSFVAIVGGAEGTLPPRGREDPFLPDVDRAGSGLATSVQRRADERRDYVAVLAASEETILVFPRADPRAQQSRLPARWLLDTAAAKTGRAVTAEALRGMSAQAWLDVVESFEQGVRADAEPGSLVERDVRSLLEWRAAGRPVARHPLAVGALGRGYGLGQARASATLTPFDGNVGAHPELVPGARRPVSATALQDWATCPFRYLLAHVLRVRDVERPEDADTISPIDEGTLVHAILEDFVRERPPTAPSDRWREDDLTRMRAIVARHCADAEDRGITGRPLLWRFAQRHIEQTAIRFLAVDAALRREHDAVPLPDGLEVGFGGVGETGADAELGDGRTVTFRGRIDRIDRSADGTRAVVYDYKTGRIHELGDDPVAGGTALQLPIYALAATARTGARAVNAYYWYTRAPTASEALDGYAVDANVQDRFVDVLETIVDGVGTGCFPADPGEADYHPRLRTETYKNCKFCAYDRLCPLDRGSAWARKADDPAVEPFLALFPEAEDDEDGAS